MPEDEDGSVSINPEGRTSDPDDEGVEFHSLAQNEMESCIKEFRDILSSTAIACASNDDCEVVQAKHTRAARLAVYRMAPPDNGIGMYSLLGGLSFAIGLAIPDTSMIWFGNPSGGFLWGVLKLSVGLFIVLGIYFSSVALLRSLGPHKPKWLASFSKWFGRFPLLKK